MNVIAPLPRPRRGSAITATVPVVSLLVAGPALAQVQADQWQPLNATSVPAPTVVQDIALQVLDHTVQQRAGETRLDWRGSQAVRPGAAWVRLGEQQLRYRRRGTGVGQPRADVQQLMLGTQLIADDEHGYRTLGVFVQSAKGRVRQASADLPEGMAARTSVESIGVHGTWFADPSMQGGWYADGWAQLGRSRSRLPDGGGAMVHANAALRGVSLEAGYSYIIRDSGNSRLLLEPQLQVSHFSYRSGESAVIDGAATAGAAGGVQVRTGLRLHGRSSDASAAVVQPYVKLDYVHELHHRNGRSNAGPAVATGIQLQIGKKASAWGEMAMQRGPRFDVAAATVGLKINW